MDIILNRAGGAPVRDQLRIQLELKILTGDLVPGQRLPSVRALARRLKLHPNTVSAAYRDLEATGHVDLRKGSGVFVRPGVLERDEEAEGLDEIVRLAVYKAFRRGFPKEEIRDAVERWLSGRPPERVVVVDPSREMAELMAEEVRQALGLAVSSCTLLDLEDDPSRLDGALALALPYHLETVGRLSRAAAVEALTLDLSDADLAALAALPADQLVLVVSHSPTVLPFAESFLRSLSGDRLRIETRAQKDAHEWRVLLPAVDVVVADILSARAVRAAHARRVIETRHLSASCLERLRAVLAAFSGSRAEPEPAVAKP